MAPQTTYEYDGVGNRTKETVAIDSTHSLTTNYFYNTLGSSWASWWEAIRTGTTEGGSSDHVRVRRCGEPDEGDGGDRLHAFSDDETTSTTRWPARESGGG